MPLAPVNGIELFYECIGPIDSDAPPLLLIHGLGSSGDDWAFQRDDFARSHRLILPDLRGSGRSSKPSGAYSIRAFADDLWTLLDRLGIATTYILGFSMGGAVAIEMSLLQPARVSKLILCNALANYRTDTLRKWYEAKLQLGFVHFLGLRRTAGFIARRLFPHDDQAPKRQRVIDVLGANPKRAYLQTIRALIGWSAIERLSELTCETLIIAADNDYTSLAEKRIEAALIPRAEMVVIENSRHGTPFDATDRFNALVLAFLER
jgi:pimeloyl-ACP methyl ester carboxylesterase